MEIIQVFEKLESHFNDAGFNIVLRARSSEYDKLINHSKKISSIFPGAESIILVGFAGNKFWPKFNSYIDNNPEFKESNPDLIDNYTELVFEEATEILNNGDIKSTYMFPFGEDAVQLDFMKLGELCGAGVRSLLGILLHPKYGTWMSLRGAVVTDHVFETYDEPIRDFTPCPPCDKPCIGACPVHTISDAGWDWESCMKFRISDDTCSKSCASRLACPYGAEERYTHPQLAYHHDHVLKSIKKYYKS